MKIHCLVLLSLLSFTARAQDTAAHIPAEKVVPFQRHSVMATVSAGFIDFHKQDFALPAGFEKNNTSGYCLFYGKLEYAVSDKISIAAAFGYDAFIYNYSQLYTGYTGPIKRYKADNYRIFNAGAIAFYHFGKKIHVKNLDPFVGVGFYLNNIRHSALAEGDSTVVSVRHNGTPYVKVGARYYITNRFSLFADAGYDQQSIFSIGASGRFLSKKEKK